MKLSEQYFFMKEDGTINIGRYPSKYIRKILESGSIQVYFCNSNATINATIIEKGTPSSSSSLIKKDIQSGILFFTLEGGDNPIIIDNNILDDYNCMCKINVFKKGDKYIMKIKQV